MRDLICTHCRTRPRSVGLYCATCDDLRAALSQSLGTGSAITGDGAAAGLEAVFIDECGDTIAPGHSDVGRYQARCTLAPGHDGLHGCTDFQPWSPDGHWIEWTEIGSEPWAT